MIPKTKILLAALVVAFVSSLSFGQNLLEEISLEDQVSNSSLVIEGNVLSKQSYWSADYKNIYTVNTIEVYKIFKGDLVKTIQLITPGGTVGLNAEIVSPSLRLYSGDVGIFMLNQKPIALATSDTDHFLYQAYSSAQGFYRYNESLNLVSNIFRTTQNISQKFYNEILDVTRRDYIQIKQYNIDEQTNKLNRGSGTLDITGITPSISTAGTESILTILGDGFGGSQGQIGFPNADDGGDTYINAYDNQVVSWSDSEIRVIIPSFAGTGPIRVRTIDDTEFFSDILNIEYAHINLVPEDDDPPMEYPTQLINDDNAGGFNWLYNSDFNINTEATEAFKRAFDSWVCTTGVNWRIGGVSNIDETQLDEVNIIRFDDGVELPNGTIGRTTSYYNGCASNTGVDWFVVELDITFNNSTNWNFSANSPTGNRVDFETVVVHELGHGLQLGHVIKPNAVMHFEVSPQTANRELAQTDIEGAEAVVERSVSSTVCQQPRMLIFSCDGEEPQVPLSDSIIVFPNPTSGTLRINNGTNAPLVSAELFDSRGRLILSTTLEPALIENVLQLGFLRPGIYSLKITSEKESINKNIVVK